MILWGKRTYERKSEIPIICPLCQQPMRETAEEGVWYCITDDAKFVEDASGK